MSAPARGIGDVCAEIKADMETDVGRMEGAAFNGRNVSEWVAGIAAAVSALAGMISTLDGRLVGIEGARPAKTRDGDELVYDGIGKRELERLRSLLTHSDRYSLTTWELVEVAADELETALATASAATA